MKGLKLKMKLALIACIGFVDFQILGIGIGKTKDPLFILGNAGIAKLNLYK